MIGSAVPRQTSIIGFFSQGTVVNPRITDRLPDELVYQGYDQTGGFTERYSDDPTCSSATPDGDFTTSVPLGDVICIRYFRDGTFTSNWFAEPHVATDPALVDLAPGEFSGSPTRCGRPTTIRRTSAPGPRTSPSSTATPRTSASNRRRPPPPAGLGGRRVREHEPAAGRAPTTAHDWTFQYDLPASVDFLAAEVAPIVDTSGAPIGTSCSYDQPNHRVICVAPGDAARASRLRCGPHLLCVHGDAPPGFTNFLTRAVLAAAGRLAAERLGPEHAVAPLLGSPSTRGGHKVGTFVPLAVLDPNPPPDPRTGNPLVDLDKTRTSPLDSAVDPGDEISYRLDYRHLDESDGDLHGAYVYDFLGRHPVNGSLQGDVVPEFVSAAATFPDAAPKDLEYTCTANSSLANGVISWSVAPCGMVTGVRWRLNSTVAPDDPAGSYRVTDPPGPVSSPSGSRSRPVGDERSTSAASTPTCPRPPASG